MDIEETCRHNGIELLFRHMSHIERTREGKEIVVCDFCGNRVAYYRPVSEEDIKLFVSQRT